LGTVAVNGKVIPGRTVPRRGWTATPFWMVTRTVVRAPGTATLSTTNSSKASAATGAGGGLVPRLRTEETEIRDADFAQEGLG